MEPAVRITGLRVLRGERVALDVDALVLPRGAVTAVIGPNGAGKSTLLEVVSGLVEPVRGEVTVLGGRPGGPRPRVAHVLQEVRGTAAVPLSVREVVRMGRYARLGPLRRFRREDHAAVDRAMERLAVADLADRQLAELSAGQRQRVHVAQGLAEEADLLLLDEPATGLDLLTQERMAAVVGEERAAGRTVIVTTHTIAEAAEADVVVLLAGRVVGSGTPADVLTTGTLAEAYGDQVHVTRTGALVVDDPHHHGGGDP